MKVYQTSIVAPMGAKILLLRLKKNDEMAPVPRNDRLQRTAGEMFWESIRFCSKKKKTVPDSPLWKCEYIQAHHRIEVGVTLDVCQKCQKCQEK